jgi:magnesium-protoporphyrin IX monomethyl ester (oxidative) cyclase
VDGFAEGVDQRAEHRFGSSTMYLYGLSPEQIADRVDADADFVGITCPFSQQAPLIPMVAKAIKAKYPDKVVVLGGPHAIAFPRETLDTNPDVDIVVRGEGELPLSELLDGKPWDAIEGLLFRKAGGEVCDKGLAPLVKNFDDIPFPARDLLPMEKYFTRSARGGDMKYERPVAFTSSRGCPFQCKFCSLHNEENRYGYKFRGRTADNVMAEIDHLQEVYGKNVVIQFEDDNILIQKERAKQIFRKLAERKVKWAIHSGVMIKLLDEELIVLMKESGCQQLNLALESGNDTVLKAMKKPMNLEHAAKVVGWCKKHDVNMLTFLMIGYPGETDQTWAQTLETLRRLRRLGLRKVASFVTNAHPGTPLYREAKENGWLREDGDLVHNNGSLQIVTPDFDEKKVALWSSQVDEVMRPYAFRAKKLLRDTFPEPVYQQALTAARRVKKLGNAAKREIMRARAMAFS